MKDTIKSIAARAIALDILEATSYGHRRAAEADGWIKHHRERERFHSRKSDDAYDSGDNDRGVQHGATSEVHMRAADKFQRARHHYHQREDEEGDDNMIAAEHLRQSAHEMEDKYGLHESDEGPWHHVVTDDGEDTETHGVYHHSERDRAVKHAREVGGRVVRVNHDGTIDEEVPVHDFRAHRLQRVKDARARNASARKLGYKNHAAYVSDDRDDDWSTENKRDHARGLRNG